ncbi:hypothetical protein EJV47_06185 [Hymenobacter gummosus]|uniref:Uncharacterized protein n=1 Tax=Hymenobacter gummosus TaxID=1776032 RepID=A0A431U532_9BACT|nr:hypothetical protein [Hymenobacter gummosus]RTQ51391.1 hypothetical protein EJV47_06185 [Hymenobacter gummosus]
MPSSPAAFDSRYFPVDDQPIAWGSTLDEAKAQLEPPGWLPSYGGWPNLRGRCQAVLGLPAVEYNLRAPARHKPIVQVSYELAPPPGHAGSGPAEPAYWVQPLARLLGPPTQAGPTAFVGGGWGSVVYTAKWETPLLSIGLSVYGGVRQEQSGPAAAGLYFDWRDVLTAARPFYEAALAQSAALAASFAKLSAPPQLVDTQYQQGYSYHDSPPLPLDAAAETRWRQSQRALYREGLLETPAPLQGRLAPTQVALWRAADQAAWAVSTTFDTVLLPDAAPGPVELVTLHPAKGGGNVQLILAGLSLQDAYKAPALPRLAAALEQAGIAVQRLEDHDC